jgi:hypothetical protein
MGDTKAIVELCGLFLVIVGMGGLVVAAALVSVALAVAVGSVLALFVGASTVYLANLANVKAKS